MVAIDEKRLAYATSLSTEEIIELMGGAERILEEDREYMERLRRMEGMVPELTERFPDQWAALTESGELLIVPSLKELRAKFEELDTRPGSNVIAFLDTDPSRWAF